ncbi:MAG TPA: hypothetical protein VFM18_16215, partial [Methanosarcina sp.]|nr:hypothetical protein [Methanosarcina sp.]
MKYTLTIQSDSKEELLALLGEAHVANAKAAGAAPKAKVEKAKPAKDALEEVKLPEAPVAAPSIFPTEAPAQAVSHVPAAHHTPAHQAVAFDRNMAITNISSTVNDLKAKGIPEQEVLKLFPAIFSKMGIA